MKKVLIIFCFFLSLTSLGQDADLIQTKHFIQCRFNDLPVESFSQLESNLKSIPFIEIVRVDALSKQALAMTTNLQTMNDELFEKWLADFSEYASCIYIGVMGFDNFKDYSKDLCNEK